MPWPSLFTTIIEMFGDHSFTDEDEMFSMYNSILSYLFPSDAGYMVTFERNPPVYPESLDFTYVYIVKSLKREHQGPVFFLDVKPHGHLRGDRTRAFVDDQMRRTYDRVIPHLVIPKLFAMSILGTRFSIYEYDRSTNKILPERIPRYMGLANDCAPASRWEHELLELDGEAQLREVTNGIQAMINALPDRDV